MTDVLIHADTVRCPELRHELPVSVPDPFLYAEVDGVRHAVVSQMEIPRLAATGVPLELHPPEELGSDELREQGVPTEEARRQLVVRFCARYGVTRATVPDGFPVRLADTLRDAGVELTPDQDLFDARRRTKTPAQLAGIERAQRAAAAGMAAVADLVRRAGDKDGVAFVDGEPLTSERLHRTLIRTFVEHDASADDVIASHGAQSAVGHDAGSGVISVGEPIVVDIWPRDNASACYTDMSRTFVVGEPPAELVAWRDTVKEAVDAAVAVIRPGVTGRAVNDRASEVIEAAGHATQRTKRPGQALDHGFYHGLGHGVGLEVHEAPALGVTGTSELVAGDVVTVEPGIYRQGFGGCRLEDIVLVTEDGARVLTDFPYDLTP